MSRVRIEIEFEECENQHGLEDYIKLVMNQMRAMPKWPKGEEGGTGLLNYICYDSSLRCVSARIVDPLAPNPGSA